MKIDFVALAAHELRTPLTEIKGYLDILHTEAKSLNKTQKEFLVQAMASAGQLGDLMHNLLNVSRIEHGELSYQPELIDYHSFIADIETSLQDRAQQQDRQITFDIPAQAIPIMADPSSIREVIDNLVSNAINHTRSRSGQITVSVKVGKTSVETSVSDNGVGIPAGAIGHLFTKFFRVDELKSTTRGTGLGLYICKSIITAHGGTIGVDSTEGKGTTFTFSLPRRTVASSARSVDNKVTVTRGAHGWIKNHPVR
jgi:signal transduction histidine kinase